LDGIAAPIEDGGDRRRGAEDIDHNGAIG
jgi:hypothetical protein